AIIIEVERGLRLPRIGKYLHDADEAVLWLADLVALADLVEASGRRRVSRDPDDDVILAAAVVGRADVIVTGDHDLLGLHEHEGIPIVTSREFLIRLGV